MSNLVVAEFPGEDGLLVVDSRLIAEKLGLDHSDWIQNIVKKYQKEAEEMFGILHFDNSNTGDRGRPAVFVWLTEEQATFYMTLSTNTPQVVPLKAELVKAFFVAKEMLSRKGTIPLHTSVYIQRLENMADHEIADTLWSVFRESAEVLILVEKQYRVPVNKMDLCDGSIGTCWSNYRKTLNLNTEVSSYIHKFRDQRQHQEPNAYEYSDLPYFRKWLREVYIPELLPKYLVTKYGKRAVHQIYLEQQSMNDYIEEITKERRSSPQEEHKYKIFLAARDAIVNRYLVTE